LDVGDFAKEIGAKPVSVATKPFAFELDDGAGAVLGKEKLVLGNFDGTLSATVGRFTAAFTGLNPFWVIAKPQLVPGNDAEDFGSAIPKGSGPEDLAWSSWPGQPGNGPYPPQVHTFEGR